MPLRFRGSVDRPIADLDSGVPIGFVDMHDDLIAVAAVPVSRPLAKAASSIVPRA